MNSGFGLGSVFAATVLVAPALAQTTTWESLAARQSHAMASAGGRVFLAGGLGVNPLQSSQPVLRDVHRGTFGVGTAGWARDPSMPRTLRDHAAAGLTISGQSVFFVFGGISAAGVPTSTTTKHTGRTPDDIITAFDPGPRFGHAMVRVPGQNGQPDWILMFGGFGSSRLNDVWKFDPSGPTWTQLLPNAPGAGLPTARFQHSMAYHETSNRIYVFGGNIGIADAGVWELDPNATPPAWSHIPATGAAPSARNSAAMAYFPVNNTLVLFGGRDASANALGDTWHFDVLSSAWQLQTPTTSPAARFEHAMATDANGDVLMLGGIASTASPQILEGTWRWNGGTWTRVDTEPQQRTGPAMAYDINRSRHVMFGGGSQAALFNDTWELSGPTWTAKSTTTSPGARTGAGMSYDPVRNNTVLFGGRDSSGPRDDTWTWNGTVWSQRTPVHRPPPTADAQLVFDPRRNAVWGFFEGRVWYFDGIDWEPVEQPTRRWRSNSTWDATRGVGVVYGGIDADNGNIALDETWIWDNGWRRVRPATSPGPRFGAGFAYDPTLGMVVLSTGSQVWAPASSPQVVLAPADTWQWDGLAWSLRPGPSPTPRWLPMSCSTSLGAFLFGGTSANSRSTSVETWRYANGSWTTLPASAPPQRQEAQMASNGSTVLLHGGFDFQERPPGSGNWCTVTLDDTWEFDGTNWMQYPRQGTSPYPGFRGQGACAADPTGGYALLWGGADFPPCSPTFSVPTDTWRWDFHQKVWTLAATGGFGSRIGITFAGPTSIVHGYGSPDTERELYEWNWNTPGWNRIDPGPITGYGAAYDIGRGQIVMFGGRIGGTLLQDTWLWSWSSTAGTGRWTKAVTPISPSAREFAHLAFDTVRNCTLLFGGQAANGIQQDTWEWDGQAWRQLSTLGTPPGAAGHAMSWDAQVQRVVAFGTMGTWDHGTQFPAATTVFGVGCPTSGPVVLEVSPSTPWQGGAMTLSVPTPPTSLGFLVLGLSDTQWAGGSLPAQLPLSGCDLLVSPDTSALLTGPAYNYVLQNPQNSSLLGLRIFGQALFAELTTNPPTLSTSAGVAIVIGAR